jgi:hypothetical protein
VGTALRHIKIRPVGGRHKSMIRKSGNRFSEKIMLQRDR